MIILKERKVREAGSLIKSEDSIRVISGTNPQNVADILLSEGAVYMVPPNVKVSERVFVFFILSDEILKYRKDKDRIFNVIMENENEVLDHTYYMIEFVKGRYTDYLGSFSSVGVTPAKITAIIKKMFSD
jgi:hypothetical protein